MLWARQMGLRTGRLFDSCLAKTATEGLELVPDHWKEQVGELVRVAYETEHEVFFAKKDGKFVIGIAPHVCGATVGKRAFVRCMKGMGIEPTMPGSANAWQIVDRGLNIFLNDGPKLRDREALYFITHVAATALHKGGSEVRWYFVTE